MPLPQLKEHRPYASLKGWMGGPLGKRGLARLEALGASWGSTERVDRIVEAAAMAPDAPPLPPLKSWRDRASFLAGVCWCLAFISARSRSSR